MLAICAKPAKKACFIGYKAECINKDKKIAAHGLNSNSKGRRPHIESIGNMQKQACCAGCRADPPPLKLHQ